MKKIIVALLLFISCFGYAQEQDEAIHNELRQLLKTVTTAMNTGNYQGMLPVISGDARITPVTSEFVKGSEGILPYMHSWFGEGKFLNKLNISFIPAGLTELSPDKTWGVSYGTGVERYTLSDGRTYDINTRWTATVVLEDNQWKLKTMHISTNFLDNPILAEATGAINKVMVYGGIGGLLVGLLLGFVVFRKKKR